MIFIFLFILNFKTFAETSDISSETTVQVSIYDLVPKSKPLKRVARLPKDYGVRVAQHIKELTPRLRECMPRSIETEPQTWVDLAITKEGISKSNFRTASPSNGCIEKVFSSAKFPKHELDKKVVVKFPIDWEKTKI